MYFKNNLKKWRQGVVVSFSIEFTLNKYYKKRWWFFAHRNDVETKKYVETTRIFRQTKLHQKKVCERTAWIFRPSKLHWKKYVDAMWVFLNSEILLEEVRGNNVDFSTIKITSKQVRENNLYFLTIENTSKKYVESTWIFRPSKLHRKKYVKSTWTFRPSKLHRKKYVKTTCIFWPSKLRRKSTWNWCGYLSKFGLRRIDVISMSNPRQFDVVCPLSLGYNSSVRNQN